MNDLVTSLIRTYVGLGIGWLVSIGVLPDSLTDQAATAATAGVIAGYYLLARLLERKWSFFGYLLGVPKTPTYS